jgi:hypothetical protein
VRKTYSIALTAYNYNIHKTFTFMFAMHGSRFRSQKCRPRLPASVEGWAGYARRSLTARALASEDGPQEAFPFFFGNACLFRAS